MAIGLSTEGKTKQALVLIIIGVILDCMDGRMARLLKVTSDLGIELDSLADLITFGVAPAFVVYHIWFSEYGFIGLIFTCLFPMFGAYRLARFNITTSEETLYYFSGVPITAAGSILAIISFLSTYFGVITVSIILLLLNYLMVSKIKIPSFKKFKFSNR
jgi:CDP-diacylglycerol--serine O-phosphatidyltransferase